MLERTPEIGTLKKVKPDRWNANRASTGVSALAGTPDRKILSHIPVYTTHQSTASVGADSTLDRNPSRRNTRKPGNGDHFHPGPVRLKSPSGQSRMIGLWGMTSTFTRLRSGRVAGSFTGESGLAMEETCV